MEAPSGLRTQTSFHFSCTNGQRARSFQSRGDGEAPRPSPRSSPSQTKVTHQQRHHGAARGRLHPGEGMLQGQRGRH